MKGTKNFEEFDNKIKQALKTKTTNNIEVEK